MQALLTKFRRLTDRQVSGVPALHAHRGHVCCQGSLAACLGSHASQHVIVLPGLRRKDSCLQHPTSGDEETIMFCDWTFHSGCWSSVMGYSAVHYSVGFVLSRLCVKRVMGGAFMSGVMCRSASSSPRQWSPQSSLGCSTRRSQSSRSKYCVLEPGTPGVQQLREVWRLWHPSEPGRPSWPVQQKGAL